MLLEITSDLIRASEPGELGRKTFEHVKSALGAVLCTGYHLDTASQRLRLVFAHGIPPEYLAATQWLDLGQEYCGAAAASYQPVVADRQRIASDPNGNLPRKLGATAYACYPLKASDGRLLGTFAVASTTRESFTDDEVAWLGTIANFLAQAWERFEVEQCLRTSEERCRLSQDAAGLGYWDFDFAGRTWIWSDQTRKLLGIEPAAPASTALLLSRVHKEDRPRVEEEVARSSNPHFGYPLHLEFRIVMPNGAVRWLAARSRIETSAAGMPVRAIGTVRDITVFKSSEEAQARLAAIVTSSADAIIGKTLDGVVTSWNKAAERMFGYPASEMIGQSIRRLVPPDRQSEEDRILTCLARSESIERHEMVLLAKDGRTLDTSITVSPMRDAEGRTIGCSKIIRDITARKRAEEELCKSEERFRSSVLHSPLPILLFNDQQQILAISHSWLDQTGYSREELRRIEDWTTRAFGEHSGEALERLRQIISTEPEARVQEWTIRTKDGRERLWSFVTSSLGTQSDGRHVFISVAQDVTDRKAHDEQVQLLMREVNHRSKNMLSLVQAIARQTAAREPDDFIGRFTERIQALAANQDLLIRNEWKGVDVEDLVRAQLAYFADLVGSRIVMRGAKLRLNAAAAQAIGLALHELATNAGKYGALSADPGHVDVGWRVDGDLFAMSWTERNGPPVSRPDRRGFGSTVIDSMAKRTVEGEVQLEYAPSGLIWRLSCPAANALELSRNVNQT
jgi:PAS domain S-box-containing protein